MADDRLGPITFNCVPLAMSREDALNYTGLSEASFRQLEREGKVKGRLLGKNGRIIYLTAQMDRAIAELFDDYVGGIEF